ncbi:MAG: Rdx family protein [Alicyclobacillus macrosporangiidus]|nr:Rdx family protein [Alicyclobacillus macrosporangiidus]
MPKAARGAEEILKKYFPKVSGLTLVPSTGGVFEVTVGGKLVFSKKAMNRFPEEGELERLVGDELGG